MIHLTRSNSSQTRLVYLNCTQTSHQQPYHAGKSTNATHHLAIRPLLAVELEVPRQRGLEERLVVGVVQVEALVLVRLPVGRDINDGLDVLAARDERTADDRVVRLAEHTHRAEEVLARGLQAVEEAADLIRRHEGLRELIVILEVHAPEGEALRVEAIVD